MIYDRLSDLSLFLFLFPSSSGARLSREHLHHLEASGMYHSPEEDSDLNGLQRAAWDGVLYNRAVTREFITHYNREGTWAKSGRDAFRIGALLPLPVDFSSVINFQTSHRRL